jgi:hypothetical protein
MENFSPESEKNELEKAYDNKLKEALKLASDFNQFSKEGKRGDLYHLEKAFQEKSMEFNESINLGIVSEVELYKKIHKEIRDIDHFAESEFSKEEWAQVYDENKKKKIKSFYKKAMELLIPLDFKVMRSDGKDIILEKGDKIFELEYQVLPDDKRKDGFIIGRVGGFGRITYLKVKKGNEEICFFKSRWIHACEDLETKKDIDSLVSVLK